MAYQCHGVLSCLLLLQLLFLISAQSNNNITLGSSLSNLDRNPYWTSPWGDFAFGFHPQQHLLAIWFDKIPHKTIVWMATDNNDDGVPVPVPVERGARVGLTSNGVLSLTSPNGTQLWKAEAANNSEISHAAMLDTGNFILSSTVSAVAWESFGHPTDTMLPTQILPLGTQLSSRLTEDDYTIGRFRFDIQSDGNLVLYTMARPLNMKNAPYWKSDTYSTGKEFVFNQSGSLYVTLQNSSSLNYYMPSGDTMTSDYYQRVTLDFDGVLRQYAYPKTTPSNEIWSVLLSIPPDICTTKMGFGEFGSGACGYNSYCRVNSEKRPECLCPPGYDYIDHKNTFAGCNPIFVAQSCNTTGLLRKAEGFEMRQIQGSDWPGSEYERFNPTTETWCRERCLNDCFCAAAIYDSVNCWLKKFPLSSGTVNSTFTGKALIKVGNLPAEKIPLSTVYDGKEKRWIVPVSIGLVISFVINLVLLVMIVMIVRGACCKKETTSDTPGPSLRSFRGRLIFS